MATHAQLRTRERGRGCRTTRSRTCSTRSGASRRVPKFAAQAVATGDLYDEAAADRLAFWDRQARALHLGDAVGPDARLERRPRSRNGSSAGTLNVAYNCVDRHVEAGHGDQVAIHFEGEPGDTRTITYADLQREVCQAANALTALGVAGGDRVAIYLPMIPEAAVAMLACARIGAPHSVVFGGFSAEALRSRIDDAEAKVVITADGGYRRGSPRRSSRPSTRRWRESPERRSKVLVVRRTGQDVAWNESRDVWWHEALDGASDRARRRGVRRRAPAVHPLHLGHHREAEGHPAHHRRLPDPGRVHAPQRLRPQARDRRLLVHGRHRLGHRAQLHRLRPAGQRRDAGDVRGHAGHPAQGPLVGARRRSTASRILYTAPTAIRTFMKWGEEMPGRVRPVVAAAARLGRRADQPRGLDLVPPGHRRRPHARSSTPGGRPRPAPS